MKSLLAVACVLFVCCAGCASPQKALNFGAAMTEVYRSVNVEAVAIRDTLSTPDAVRLSDAMIASGEALRAYNLAAMVWFTAGQRPADFAAADARLRLVLGQVVTLVRELKTCRLKL